MCRVLLLLFHRHGTLLVFPELGGYKVSINTHSPKGFL